MLFVCLLHNEFLYVNLPYGRYSYPDQINNCNNNYNQWCSQEWAWQGLSPPKCLLSLATEIEKYRDYVFEQSNILIKQSVGQVVLYQLTESGYTTDKLMNKH